jgi:hypothetical protein
MKKQIFALAFLASILQGTFSFASILLVKEYGVNNTYSGIQLALNAAANNDTIVVYDKPSGQNWIENITIDKNIWLMHPVDTVRFKLFGSITIVPKAGMDLYLVGYDLQNNFITVTTANATATATNRAKITVSNCQNITYIDFNQDWIDARIFNNQTNISNYIRFRHGICVGNVVTNQIEVQQESTIAAQNDSLIIIGNKSSRIYVDTKECFLICNNYLLNGSNVWSIDVGNRNNAGVSIIQNNSCFSNYGITTHAFSNTKIVNNIIWNANNITGQTLNNSNAGGSVPFISHNIFRYGLNIIGFNLNNELNYFANNNTNYALVDSWGRASSGNTLLIDKGNYLGEYYDINLTRNDIGTYGGPYSIDNYINASTSKAGVLYINMPHTLTNINQLINVKASAGSKF